MFDPISSVLSLTMVTGLVLVPYLLARKAMDSPHSSFPGLSETLHRWRSRKLVKRIEEMVLMVGHHTDGVLKGQIPRWLVPHDMSHGGHGEFKVLVSCNGEYFMMHFKVEGWIPSYGPVEPIEADLARRVMELHLEYLGRWKLLAYI